MKKTKMKSPVKNQKTGPDYVITFRRTSGQYVYLLRDRSTNTSKKRPETSDDSPRPLVDVGGRDGTVFGTYLLLSVVVRPVPRVVPVFCGVQCRYEPGKGCDRQLHFDEF